MDQSLEMGVYHASTSSRERAGKVNLFFFRNPFIFSRNPAGETAAIASGESNPAAVKCATGWGHAVF